MSIAPMARGRENTPPSVTFACPDILQIQDTLWFTEPCFDAEISDVVLHERIKIGHLQELSCGNETLIFFTPGLYMVRHPSDH